MPKNEPMSKSKAMTMVEELRRDYDLLGRGYVTTNEFIDYLATHGWGTSRQSVYNYIQLLTQLNLIKKDAYGAGFLYFVLPQVKVEDKQRGIGDFIDDTFTKK